MKFAHRCSQRLLLAELLLLACLSPAALALGLGDIHLKSTLDAPLDADIEVVDADADDLTALKASLAPRDTFHHFGADYPAFLGTLSFTPEHTPDGHTVLHVHSSGVANEPLATLLIEVNWPRGHLVREYTVLLDPPVFNSQSATVANVAAPKVGDGAQSGAIEHAETTAVNPPSATPAEPSAEVPSAAAPTAPAAPSAATAPASPAAAPSEAPSAPTSAPPEPAPAGSASAASAGSGASSEAGGGAAPEGHYTVRPGDTLSTIATQIYHSSARAARDQALVAIYRANPQAFHGNMNQMYSGRVLTLPGDTELSAISPGEALSEVRHQYSSWRDEHGGAGAEASSAAATGAAGGQLKLVAPGQAAQEASQQAAPGPTGAAGPSSGAGGSGASGGNAALQQRVQQLESQLSDSQRLLQLRSAELAALQARIQAQASSGAASSPGSASAPSATVAPPAPSVAPPPAPPAAVAPPATPAAAPAPVPVPATVPHPAPPPVVATAHPPHAPATHSKPAAAESGNSMLDLIEQYWYVPAALIAVLIVLLALRFVRGRQEDAFDRSLGQLSEPSGEMATTSRTDTVPVRTLTSTRQEPSYRVEESGKHERPVFDEPLEATVTGSGEHLVAPAAVADNVSAEAPVALDQGDPLAEADFHMAYGLYDQAAELVQIAINRDPKRRDLKLKLLEVFFVWGNKDRFLQSAHELATTRNQALPGEWEKILIMGRQIAPEDSLFADGRVAGAAQVVDLNLEGGQNRVDFDLLGEPSIATTQEAPVELDLGAALGQPSGTEVTGESRELSGSGVDFVLDDAERVNGTTGTTREMPAAATAVTGEMPAPRRAAGSGVSGTETVRVVNRNPAEAEVPTVEQLHLRGADSGTIRQKIDAATRSSLSSGEQTAELAIDDLGLELGAFEGDEEALTPDADAPTLLAELDDDTRRMLENAASDDATEIAPAPARAAAGSRSAAGAKPAAGSKPAPGTKPGATGTWMFTDTDFAAIAPKGKPTATSPTQVITQVAPQPQVDTGATAPLVSLHSAGLDLDLGGLDSLNDLPGNGIDLDVGTAAPAPSPAFSDTQKLAGDPLLSDEEALPELEPVTLSEVGTKLDLARAYMDMGDPEGARSILSEVMSEGSMSQKQEARRLMDALPG